MATYTIEKSQKSGNHPTAEHNLHSNEIHIFILQVFMNHCKNQYHDCTERVSSGPSMTEVLQGYLLLYSVSCRRQNL